MYPLPVAGHLGKYIDHRLVNLHSSAGTKVGIFSTARPLSRGSMSIFKACDNHKTLQIETIPVQREIYNSFNKDVGELG